MDEKAQGDLFLHIESGINSADEYLSTAVATGLIEALISTSDNNSDLKSIIDSKLGKTSREYVIAWNKFCGLEGKHN